MSDTVFEKIVRREIPADIVYEDDDVLGFLDRNPKAPTHVLFVPKHVSIPSALDLTKENAFVVGQLFLAAKNFAAQQGMDGYRLQVNVGKGGGQEVFYLHVHFQSQEKMKK